MSNSSSRRARMVRSVPARSGATGAIDPLAAVGMLLPSGRDEQLGRRAVARRQHPGLVAEPAQHPGQPEHLGLHTTWHGEAVGADQADPHLRRP